MIYLYTNTCKKCNRSFGAMQLLDYCDKHRNAQPIVIPDFDAIAEEKREAHRLYVLNRRRKNGAVPREQLTDEQRAERRKKSKAKWYKKKNPKQKIVTSVAIHSPKPKAPKVEKELRIPKMTYRYILNPKTVYYFDDKEKMNDWISRNVKAT